MTIRSIMKKFISLSFVIAFAACASAPSSAPAPAPVPATAPAPLAGRATALLNEIAAGRFDDATSNFAPVLKEKLPAKTLADVWAKIQQQAGAFKQFGSATVSHEGANDVVVVPASFANLTLDARVVYDQSGSVAGLFFSPR